MTKTFTVEIDETTEQEYTFPYPPMTGRTQYGQRRNGQRFLKPEILAWRDEGFFIVRMAKKKPILSGRIFLRMSATPPDIKKRDEDNLKKAVYDALTEAGVWLDDSQVKTSFYEMAPYRDAQPAFVRVMIARLA